MSRDDPWDAYSDRGRSRLFCDLTQSWSAVGGGVGTYLRHKRQHILQDHAAPPFCWSFRARAMK
jgi:alpha-1,6-mannosyltransferase